jgi:esterase/lipase superfamily enzyme
MADRFVMSARAVRGQEFIAEPGETRFLRVPEGKLPKPAHAIDAALWHKQVRRAATWGKDARDPSRARGDLLIFVHGYNNAMDEVMQRHRLIESGLDEWGWKGAVASFDWPSDDKTLNYLEDRHDAKTTAMQLVTDGIRALAALQAPDCTINVHLLAHSTGAYVVREAFDDADDARLNNNAWMVSQLVLIGADVSAGSLSAGNSCSESLYRHCVRLTNYSSLFDSVLKLSNAKRVGMAPRVGRVGLPSDAPTSAVNVDCSAYFEALSAPGSAVAEQDQVEKVGTFAHSWHIGNRTFMRDLFETLRGDLDRGVIPTRAPSATGLALRRL